MNPPPTIDFIEENSKFIGEKFENCENFSKGMINVKTLQKRTKVKFTIESLKKSE